jgi:curved DNA-binding protein CbpA
MDGPASGESHQDPYRVLGVDTSASRQDIARAYRRAVQRAHPDTQPQDPHASARFQALTNAYDLLSDPARRADYDRTHPAAGPSAQLHHPAHGAPWLGSPRPRSMSHGPPVWAGPVLESPAAASQQQQGGTPADFEDPPVILGMRPGQGWRWLW